MKDTKTDIQTEVTERDKRFLDRSLNGSMWKLILHVGTPLALYQGLNGIFSVLDTMMASHISKESVSAVAYLTQLNAILAAVGGGLAVGAGIQISRAYGEENFQLVKKRVSTLYVLCLGIGLLMLGCILPFTGKFLALAGTPQELIAEGSRYFIVELVVMVIKFLNNVYIAVERARGNSRRILWLNLVVTGVKLSLTALFVYGLNGDLVTIGIASLISQLSMLIPALKNTLGGSGAFSFSPKAAVLQDREATLPMVTQSLPVIAEKALFAFGKTVVNSMCTVYGAVMVGAMGVSNNLGGITTNPQNGFQEGAASIISQNFGAKRYKRVLDAFFAVLAVNVIIGAVISAVELWHLDWLAGFFDSGDAGFHRYITQTYRYEALGAIPLGINSAVMALLYGLGKTRLTLVLNFSRVFLFRIPVFWFLQNFTQAGEASVGLVMMISNTLVTILAVVIALTVILRYRREYRLCGPVYRPAGSAA